MTTNDALIALLQSANVKYGDKIIPVRGEPCIDPTTKETHIRFTRDGVPGEFHLTVKVEHTPPFKGPKV